MRLKTTIIFLTFALPVFNGAVAKTALAQEPVDVSRKAEQNEATAKGLSLIEEITVEARALRLAENRVIVQAAAAELLWAYDEKSARALFSEAMSNLDDITNDTAQDDPKFRKLEQLAEASRRELLLKVARHDPSWARELMRTTSRPSWPGNNELQRDLRSVAQMMAPAGQPMRAVVEDREQESLSLPENRTTIDTTDVANGGSSETNDSFYSEAAAKAQKAGDFDRARQMASHIKDSYERNGTLANINQQYLLDAARSGKVEETLNSLAFLHTSEERASTLVELAVVLAQSDKKERAHELLNQARNLLGNRARSLAQISAQLRVACALAMFDLDQGFEMIEMIVHRLNELAGATVVVDGFMTEEQYTRDNELMLKPIMRFLDVFSDESEQDNGLIPLALVEFDRMKRAADKFQHTELHILAYLSLANNVLAQQKKGLRR